MATAESAGWLKFIQPVLHFCLLYFCTISSYVTAQNVSKIEPVLFGIRVEDKDAVVGYE